MVKFEKQIITIYQSCCIICALVVAILFNVGVNPSKPNLFVTWCWFMFAIYTGLGILQIFLTFYQSKHPFKHISYLVLIPVKNLVLFSMMHLPFHPQFNLPVTIFSIPLMALAILDLFLTGILYLWFTFQGEDNLISCESKASRIVSFGTLGITTLLMTILAVYVFYNASVQLIYVYDRPPVLFYYGVFFLSLINNLSLYFQFMPSEKRKRNSIFVLILIALQLLCMALFAVYDTAFLVYFFFRIAAIIVIAQLVFKAYSFGLSAKE